MADRRLAEAGRGSAQLVDLQVDWHVYEYAPDYNPNGPDRDSKRWLGPRVARFGGLWDRVGEIDPATGNPVPCYVGDAPTAKVIGITPAQVAFARWFEGWVGRHIEGTEPADTKVVDVLLAGGRRAGKTTIGIDAVIAYALAVPESITWVITPSDQFFDEPWSYLEAALPAPWFTSLMAPHWTVLLANGSEITLRSGHTPRKLKHGRCDFGFLNEAQQIQERAKNQVLPGVADVGGLVLSAANPPDVGDPGEWVFDMAVEAERGMRAHGRYFFFNPELNPEIDHATLHAARESMSPHEYAIQILGELKLPPDAVLHSWRSGAEGNERPVPTLGKDVTRAFTQKFEGHGVADIISMDPQNYPWHAAVVWRVFDNPEFPGILELALHWIVGEVYVDAGDEGDVARELLAGGIRGDNSIVIMDASSDWQQATRDPIKQREKYRGMGSMDIMRAEGFRDVVPPDHLMDGNPKVVDRCRAANSKICNAYGRRFVYADPERAPRTIQSIRKWRNRNGKPDRRGLSAHGGDAMTYYLWRFFPRRLGASGKVETQNRNSTAETDRARPARDGFHDDKAHQASKDR